MSQVQLSSNVVNIIKTQNGEDGLNQATIFLYQRAASEPQPLVPQSDVTYTFSTGLITGNIGDWSQSMPPKDSNPCWVTTAVTISREDWDIIYSSDWKQPEKLAEDGADGTSVSITSTSHVGNTTTVNFSDGTSITIDDGADGKGIQSIVEYYKTSSSDDTPPTGTWYTTLQVPDANNPYLWNYEYIIYTDTSHSETSKRIIGTYSAPGTPGADGKGIANITNYYAKTAGTTAPQIGSQDWIACPPGAIPTLDETDKYLWNYEHTVYTDSTTSNTTPHIISMFAKDGRDGKDATDVSQYTIHTNVQEILKFIIAQPTSGKYEFSLDELRINAYNIKDQIAVSNTQIANQVCKYADLDINIVNYKLKEIIKESAYSRYVEIKQNDDIFFYFELGVLYQDSLDSTLLNNLNNSFTAAEKTEIVKNIQEFFNTDLASVDVLVYGQVIEQDFIKANIDATTFNEDKTLFYTKTVQNNVVTYTQCTSQSVFDPTIDYYAKKITEYNVEKYISVKNGLSSEMLAFSVNAGSINTAIQNTKLKFNANGLTITNGGIKIYTDDEVDGEEVFRIEASSENENEKRLYLKGSGVFTGTIYAQSGEFTGTVHAQNGEFNGTVNASGGSIGGFTIDSDSIYAGNDKQNSPLLLQSSDGSLINVDNIQIGTGAKIKDYLEIGNLKLLNPELHSNVMELTALDGIIILNSTDFEQGGISVSSPSAGAPIDLNTRIRTQYIKVDASKEYKIIIEPDYLTPLNIYCYGNNTDYSSYITAKNPNSTTGLYTFPEGTEYVRIALRKNGSAAGSTDPQNYINPSEVKKCSFYFGTDWNTYFTLTNTGDILGKNWSITKDENGFVTANFGNIIAQNGIFTGEVTASVINATTLNSVNFVTENVRAMGGAFIFKPTFKITTITPQGNNIVDFILELSENDKNYFNLDLTNDYIISISGKDTHIGKINSINLSTNKVSVYLKNADYNIFVTDGTIANYQTLTLFGQATVDALIGINSDDNWTGDIMPPRALIMEEFTALTETSSGFGDIDYTPKLLLGNLAPLRQYNISGLENITGYGLYADNVFLRGSLTTSGGNSYNYAGVNTQGPISFNYNSWNTNGATTTPSSQYSDDKIIFWGGAAGVQSSQIQVSPFIVTDKGNIFARSGEFKGSVISDSLITNTIIKAPVIYGNNNQREGHEGEPSLKIYNTDTSTGGIGFYKQVNQIDEERSGVDQDDILTLSISVDGFSHFIKKFISFDDLDITGTFIQGGISTSGSSYGKHYNTVTRICSKDFIKVIPGETYTVNINSEEGKFTNVFLMLYDKDKNGIRQANLNFTAQSGEEYIKIVLGHGAWNSTAEEDKVYPSDVLEGSKLASQNKEYINFKGDSFSVNDTVFTSNQIVNDSSVIYFNQTDDSKLKLDYNNQRGIEITKDQIINYGGYTVNEGIVEIKTVVQNNNIKTLKYYVNSENYYCLMVS